MTSGRLNPLQLLLLGTSLELSYFICQLPTGVLADLVSRRLCVLTGLFIVGAAQVMESLSPSFGNLMAGQAVLGLGDALATQTRATHRAVIAVPGLVPLLGMTLFVGMWSESFDRLWGAFLLRDITFPHVGGVHPAMWFSLFACGAAVLGLGGTEVAKRRTQRLGQDSVVGALLVLTLAIAAAAVGLATAHAFVVVAVMYLVVSVLRPVLYPLVSGWLVGRIEPSVRATALSARDMFDSAGQIVGGPVFGAIWHVRVAADRPASRGGGAGPGGSVHRGREPPCPAVGGRGTTSDRGSGIEVGSRTLSSLPGPRQPGLADHRCAIDLES